MSVQLLDKTRKIGKLLHNNNAPKVVFNDICDVLQEVLSSGVYVFSAKGKVLGFSDRTNTVSEPFLPQKVGEWIDPMLNERLLSVLSTKENVNLMTLGFDESLAKIQGILCPLDIIGKRYGTLFIYREDLPFDIEDIILCEYATTVIALELLRSVDEEIAEDTHKHKVVASAFQTLSASEKKALHCVLKEMKESEAILVASQISKQAGITRSVIVNALRKMESAGILEARSAGMKGTYVKVLNDAIYTAL